MSDSTPALPEPVGQPYSFALPPPVGQPYSFAPTPLQPAPANPGRVLGIVGFVLSFFMLLNFGAFVISLVGLFRSRRAGLGNPFALAGVIISAFGIAATIVILVILVPLLVSSAETCARLGDGVHHVGNTTYTCTPTSFGGSTN